MLCSTAARDALWPGSPLLRLCGVHPNLSCLCWLWGVFLVTTKYAILPVTVSTHIHEFQPLHAEVSGVSDQACEWSEQVKQASDAKQSEAKPKECAERAVQENKCSERLSGLL